MLEGDILVTGGTGTLGRAIARRATREAWPCTLTIYSRDPVRQQAMRREYPHFRYVLGDVCDRDRLMTLACGHDAVLHLAAQKHIPDAEGNPAQCYAVNVQGSINVLDAARAACCDRVLLISTDKACWPVNVYGASKFAAERIYQQAALETECLQVNVCRYGNVLGSTGSVIQVWRQALERGDRPRITDPTMTRFWLTVEQAVDLIVYALGEPTGTVTIPRLPALSMGRMAEYVLGDDWREMVDVTGLRPGEKMHEMLLTPQEVPFCVGMDHLQYMRLFPVTGEADDEGDFPGGGYTSDRAPELTRAQLEEMLR